MNKLKSDSTALLLIDVINDFKFEDGKELFKYAVPMAKNLANLKKELKKFAVPAIYVNDNFTRWRDDFRTTIEALRDRNAGGG